MPEPSEKPRRPAPRGALAPGLRRLYRAAIAVALLALALLVLDAGLGVRLPQPLRPALPFALFAGLCVALALGVGAYGTPQPPGKRDPEAGP